MSTPITSPIAVRQLIGLPVAPRVRHLDVSTTGRPLKGGQIGDDTAEVTVGPGAWPPGPPHSAWQPDVGQADRRVTEPGPATPWDPTGRPGRASLQRQR